MEDHITGSVEQMADSHRELARILDAKSKVVGHMASLICAVPDTGPDTGELSALMEQYGDVTKSVAAYLNSLSELEDALYENLKTAVKELRDPDADE